MLRADEEPRALARGRHVGRGRRRRDGDSLRAFVRQLLAAVVCQAVADALDGDADAARFVETEGVEIARALGLPACCRERWRTADVARCRHTIGDEAARRARFGEKRRSSPSQPGTLR